MLQPLLWIQWISFSLSIGIYGLLVLFPNVPMPDEIRRFYKYGKAADLHRKSLLSMLDLPKSWFFHFYLFSMVFFSYLLWSVLRVYTGHPLPELTSQLLNTFSGPDRPVRVPPESTIICILLALAQVTRRLYECCCVSVYSNASMNIVHYVIAIVYYFGVGLSVIAESYGFEAYRGQIGLYHITWKNFITFNHVLGIMLFMVASGLQWNTHISLASLRKNNKGEVVSYGHKIPSGGMFEYLSCPHYFAEIVIYFALNLVLSGRSITWWLVCTFVFINQIMMGLVNHQCATNQIFK